MPGVNPLPLYSTRRPFSRGSKKAMGGDWTRKDDRALVKVEEPEDKIEAPAQPLIDTILSTIIPN